MKRLSIFLKTTVVGGLLVLLPLFVFYLLLAEMLELVVAMATPIADVFPKVIFNQVKMPVIVAVILILGASFLFGAPPLRWPVLTEDSRGAVEEGAKTKKKRARI